MEQEIDFERVEKWINDLETRSESLPEQGSPTWAAAIERLLEDLGYSKWTEVQE